MASPYFLQFLQSQLQSDFYKANMASPHFLLSDQVQFLQSPNGEPKLRFAVFLFHE